MRKSIFITLLLCITIATQAFCFSPTEKPSKKNKVTIENTQFKDQLGRQLILNGINLVNKNPKVNYIGPEDESTFRNFKKWGFNVIRLGIIWDGLEPEPGKYDEAYLQKIDKQIEMAAANGLFVFLDMHQDLFSVKYADGAPRWATLDEGKPHHTGAIWSDAYMISPAVQTAWDNFWKNAPINGKLGIQDHYAQAWKHVAKRYKNNPTVIGFDIMNEPFVGSQAQQYMPLLFGAYAQLISKETGKEMTIQEVAAMWQNTASRFEALQKVSDKKRFAKVIDAVYQINSQFEAGPLQAFYQKVANAIRSVDNHKILFFNHSYFCNSGVTTALKPMTLPNGKKDAQVAYAAHGYDLLVDTDQLSSSSDGRLQHIFQRINESGQRMNVPVLIGEWGALGGHEPGRIQLAYKNLRFIEKYQFSNTYWAYGKGTEDYPYFKALIRPYPEAICGQLKSYHFDETKSLFTCQWEESASVNASNRIFIPAIKSIPKNQIKLNGKYSIELIPGSNNGYLIIPAIGKKVTRKLTIQLQ
ncbi:hypothetical protein EMN47_10800 [Prolixibacteraceae bacterium JC049]|nr:hypothetical protein [Prolixibacteraceae bacterium JC049]